MKKEIIKEEILKHYKKEFYMWLISVLVLGLSALLFIKEVKTLQINLNNKRNINEKYFKLSKEINQLKERIKMVDIEKTYMETKIPVSATYSLRNLNQAIVEMQSLSKEMNGYLLIHEMSLKLEGIEPYLTINGDLIVFQ